MDIQGLSLDLANRDQWVAIIGSRKPTVAEKQASYRLGQKCVRNGKIVVSGLAIGIDAEAHQGAIDAGGKTIAIVNTLSKQPIYPKDNRPLARSIIANGCILYPYDTVTTYDEQFNNRLRERDVIVAFLCPTIVIVKDSSEPIIGGTRWATNYGYKYGKKVFRYDSNDKFHENPLVKEDEIWWNKELDVESFCNQCFI